MSPEDQEAWLKALTNREDGITMENPPRQLYRIWT